MKKQEIGAKALLYPIAEEKYLTNGTPNIRKLSPFLFVIKPYRYWRIGEYFGELFKIGRTYSQE